MNEVGECPRCKLEIMELEREVQQRRAERTPDVLEQVRTLCWMSRMRMAGLAEQSKRLR